MVPTSDCITQETEPRLATAAEGPKGSAGAPRGAQRPPSPTYCITWPRCTEAQESSNPAQLWPLPPTIPPPPPPVLRSASLTPSPLSPSPPPPPPPRMSVKDEGTSSSMDMEGFQSDNGSSVWPSPPPPLSPPILCGWENGPCEVRCPRTPPCPAPRRSASPYSERTLTASSSAFDCWSVDEDTDGLEDDVVDLEEEEKEEEEEEEDADGWTITEGTVLTGTHGYRVEKLLGAGVYGTVLKCKELPSEHSRAVKILRLTGNWAKAARNEARALGEISIHLPDDNALLRLFESFIFKDSLILVTEHLQVDLASFMLTRAGNPLRMDAIACILKQLLKALQMLKSLGIIHADIKPDNVMLINHYVYPFQVKLIDFSNTSSARENARRPPYAQSRWYRAPEVVLGHTYGCAVDMWSLGCVAAELACARPLFPARNELQLLRAICQMCGPMPPRVLLRGPTCLVRFYRCAPNHRNGLKLMNDAEYVKSGGKKVDPPKWPFFESLDSMGSKHMSLISTDEKEEFTVDIVMFQILLTKLLELDQETRISPSEALGLPFVDSVKLRSN